MDRRDLLDPIREAAGYDPANPAPDAAYTYVQLLESAYVGAMTAGSWAVRDHELGDLTESGEQQKQPGDRP